MSFSSQYGAISTVKSHVTICFSGTYGSWNAMAPHHGRLTPLLLFSTDSSRATASPHYFTSAMQVPGLPNGPLKTPHQR